MKKVRRFISLLLVVFAIVGFLSLLTQSQNIISYGGTFCNEGKNLYCWAQIPYWYCLDNGYYRCSDPIQQ